MSAASWVSVLALSGWLILMLGAMRVHRIGRRKALAMALIWGAIFLLVTTVIAGLDG